MNKFVLRFSPIVAVLFSCFTQVAYAQTAPPTSAPTTAGCNNQAFASAQAAMGGFGGFFYGPFFKYGCLGAFAISAITLLMDEGNLGRVGTFVMRAILVVAFIAGLVSWIGTPSAGC